MGSSRSRMILLGVILLITISKLQFCESFIVTASPLLSDEKWSVDNSSSHERTCMNAENGSTCNKENVVNNVENKSTGSRFFASSFNVANYHLLWSPGEWKKLLVGTTSLFAAHILGRWFLVIDSTLQPSTGLLTTVRTLSINFILPLLASACCFIQLIMNIFAFGCAGFNTILGPIRPYFMSLLIYLTVINNIQSNAHKSHLTMTALRWSIALLPEIVDIWNNRNNLSKLFSNKNTTINEGVTDDSKISGINDASPSAHLTATVQLDIPTMGCVACINTIDKALNQIKGVQSASSSLKPFGAKGGDAEIKITANSQVEMNMIVDSLIEAVSNSGFSGSSVTSLRVKEI